LTLVLSLLAREVRLHLGNPLQNETLRGLGAPFVATLVGALLMASTLLIDQAMTSTLPPGAVAALNYANRLVTVPLGLTAAALGTVVLPFFSTLASEERWAELRAVIARYLRLVALVSVPISVGLASFAAPLTDLLLHRGAFTGADVPTVASTLAALALEVPFYTAVIVLMRLALALRMNVAIAWISFVNVVLNVTLNAWFSSFMGVAGIALSTSVVYACSSAMLWLVTHRRLSDRAGRAATPAARA
jgi:putative peptidoglycan lipid II flippase